MKYVAFDNSLIALINVRNEGIALVQYDLATKQSNRIASKLFSYEPNKEEIAFRAYVRVAMLTMNRGMSGVLIAFRCEVDADRCELVE